MPFRRRKKKGKKRKFKTKRFRKKRVWAKKKRHGNQKVALFRGQSFLPQKYKCCHVFYDFIQLDVESGGKIVISFQMLDLTDPGFEVPDRAVDSFLLLADVYNQWRVTSLTWHATVGNNQDSPFQMIAAPRQDAVIFASDIEMMQQPYVKSVLVGGSSGGSSTKSLSGSVNMSTLGGRNVEFDDFGITSGVGTTLPAQDWRLIFMFSNPGSPGEPTMDLSFRIKLVYNVTWWDRDIIANS